MVFLFALLIATKSTTMENISVFENLNIYQLKLLKEDLQFNNLIIIWLGNLKIRFSILSMQAYDVDID